MNPARAFIVDGKGDFVVSKSAPATLLAKGYVKLAVRRDGATFVATPENAMASGNEPLPDEPYADWIANNPQPERPERQDTRKSAQMGEVMDTKPSIFKNVVYPSTREFTMTDRGIEAVEPDMDLSGWNGRCEDGTRQPTYSPGKFAPQGSDDDEQAFDGVTQFSNTRDSADHTPSSAGTMASEFPNWERPGKSGIADASGPSFPGAARSARVGDSRVFKRTTGAGTMAVQKRSRVSFTDVVFPESK
jgi:hypothetical protein